MTDQTYLIDAADGTRRFRVDETIAAGRSYQIVRVHDTDTGRAGCARAISYDQARRADLDYVEQCQHALERAWRVLDELDHPWLAAPVAFFRASGGQAEFDDEPVMVCDYVEGTTLFDWIRRDHPEGLAADDALGMLSELVDFLAAIHRDGFIYRDVDPRHFIVDADGQMVGAVGLGNIIATGGEPIAAKMDYAEAPYVAPEVRGERSGTLLRPTADGYGLGALASFVLTGQEPRTVVENPLTWTAYDRLSNLEPPGLALVVARLIQPHFKKRFGRMQRLAPYMSADGLPTAQTDGFGMLLLPAPFSGVEDPANNRGVQSKLSDGPLISVDTPDQPDGPPAAEPAAQPGMPRSWSVAAALVAVAIVVGLWAVGII